MNFWALGICMDTQSTIDDSSKDFAFYYGRIPIIAY